MMAEDKTLKALLAKIRWLISYVPYHMSHMISNASDSAVHVLIFTYSLYNKDYKLHL